MMEMALGNRVTSQTKDERQILGRFRVEEAEFPTLPCRALLVAGAAADLLQQRGLGPEPVLEPGNELGAGEALLVHPGPEGALRQPRHGDHLPVGPLELPGHRPLPLPLDAELGEHVQHLGGGGGAGSWTRGRGWRGRSCHAYSKSKYQVRQGCDITNL